MKIKNINTFDSNGLPSLSLQELYEARDNSSELDRRIFSAILSDDLVFIKQEIDAGRLHVNDYIIEGAEEESAIPILKLAITGCSKPSISVSYKVAKYLLSHPNINVNAYGSSGENTLLSLCDIPYAAWADACLPSAPRKEVATLLFNHKQTDLNMEKYEYLNGVYKITGQTAEKIALNQNNNFMLALIHKGKIPETEIKFDSSQVQLVQLHQQMKQAVAQAQQEWKTMLTQGDSLTIPTELATLKSTLEAATQMAKGLRPGFGD